MRFAFIIFVFRCEVDSLWQFNSLWTNFIILRPCLRLYVPSISTHYNSIFRPILVYGPGFKLLLLHKDFWVHIPFRRLHNHVEVAGKIPYSYLILH